MEAGGIAVFSVNAYVGNFNVLVKLDEKKLSVTRN
jgi:hypothetical protein